MVCNSTRSEVGSTHLYQVHLTEIKPMTYQLETALHCLNVLIDEQGYEFPKAIAKTIENFGVSRKALIALYDAQ
jgi:hypothetical protein